ncbi:hypothetical protein C7I87_20990 [Mesorhizobium sp. SARCC-RB16n]|uniref:hypothetical protein n=1 Tax=Mesorhizobium sp. SARCC-RB16n TaxID=2116687 RepID=UPI00122F3EDD|nr:hypothetical protein [Mesorhizobium sp. SARCC-RB16n]KAA3448629.1 hypothetical protein C7I87_20990 [Mesorhizobium sp. SARCC-RB16n]
MDNKAELEQLHQRAHSLEQSIADMDTEIERATHDLAGGGDPGALISFLQERRNAQLGLTHDLGKVGAGIERLENLLREEQEQPQERLAADKWQEHQPLAQEDHLDWFKEKLAENPPQLDEIDEAERLVLQDMEREPGPDDHLDWFPRRG